MAEYPQIKSKGRTFKENLPYNYFKDGPIHVQRGFQQIYNKTRASHLVLLNDIGQSTKISELHWKIKHASRVSVAPITRVH